MKRRILLILVAVLEILSGLAGLIFVLGATFGSLPKEVVPMLWYGFFPAATLVVGLMLLLRQKHGFALSVLVQLLQVPLIITPSLTLNLGLALQLRINGYWASPDGGPGTFLGINFLALGALVVLWLCHRRDVVAASGGIEQIVGREPRERASHEASVD